MCSTRGEEARLKGNFNAQKIMNINKDMKLHSVRDTHSSFYEGVQNSTSPKQTNKCVPISCPAN